MLQIDRFNNDVVSRNIVDLIDLLERYTRNNPQAEILLFDLLTYNSLGYIYTIEDEDMDEV
jgi:hypothetical protein